MERPLYDLEATPPGFGFEQLGTLMQKIVRSCLGDFAVDVEESRLRPQDHRNVVDLGAQEASLPYPSSFETLYFRTGAR